jgi:hypothetical protein
VEKAVGAGASDPRGRRRAGCWDGRPGAETLSSATVLYTEPVLLVPFGEATTSCPPERAELVGFSAARRS